MVLLVNTFITNISGNAGLWDSLGVFQSRGHLHNDNKIDILKYTLASLAKAYPWTRVIIKAQLDDEYALSDIEKDLEAFIREEFKDFDLHFSNKRNLIQQDWKDTYELINDDYVFTFCAHDHVIMDHSTEELQKVINAAKQTYPNQFVTVTISHWSEFIRNAKFKGPTTSYNTHSNIEPVEPNVDYKLEEYFISYNKPTADSIHILSKELYYDCFFIGNWDDFYNLYPSGIFKSGHIELPRIDGVGITDLGFIRKDLMRNPIATTKILIPYKEIARHFDGYFYHGITNNQAPSLDIPIGFFEKNMKIRYGYDDRKEGWVNINPKNPYYYAHDLSGADYKFTLKEIPLFWKDRITEIDINPEIDEEEILKYRLNHILEMVYTSPNHDPYIEEKLASKILNKYLEIFPEYTLDI
jgi:hypothetical protein